jgi:uncharacterized membrane-anchored protein
MLGPPLFGRLDPGERTRRRWIVGCTLGVAAMFGLMACGPGVVVDVLTAVAMSLLAGYIVLQYADVKAAYPARMTGRAMAVFTMAMFLGVALMQWLTGLAATAAVALHADIHATVLGSIAGFLLLGVAAFTLLPGPPAASAAGPEPSQSSP